MTPEAQLQAFEAAKSRRQALRILGGADIAEPLFLRVAALSGQDPAACIRLAKRATWLIKKDPSSPIHDSPLTIDPRSLAFLHRARAVGHRAAGHWQAAADAFLEAARHVKGTDKWLFSLGAIDSLARAGQPAEAVKYGRRAIRGLKQNPELAARARLNVANALAWQDLNPQAAREYRLALRNLPPESKAEQAIAHLGISTSSLYSGDPKEAEQSAREAEALFQALGMDYHANLARLNMAQSDLQLGRPDDAVHRFLELLPAFEDSPPDRARIQEFLGDCYVRMNLKEEAQSAYRSALTGNQEMPLNAANCRYGLANLTDNITEASRLYRRAARDFAKVKNRPWELAAVGRAIPARTAAAIQELRKIKSRFLHEDLGLWAAEYRQDPLPPKPKSIPLEWKHAWLKAKIIPTKAAYRKAFALIERDRLAIRTPSAALRFFDDRGQAVNEYLELLLNHGAIEEAISVISRARSAALIDEIVAARSERLSPETLHHLDALRAAFAADQNPGARRRTNTTATTPRAWTEALWTAINPHPRAPRETKTDSDIWLDTRQNLYRIAPQTPPISPNTLAKKLDWLEFSLFEPMLNPAADPQKVNEDIRQLKALVGPPKSTISPDGLLWRVPWTLLTEQEVTLLLNPADSPAEITLRKNPRVAIWCGHADDLPHLQAEIEAVKAAFPKSERVTTRKEIRQTYGQTYDLIHVAGHARINRQSPALSHIEFPDGPLYAAEIARSGIRTDLAIVAACQTGIAAAHQTFEPEGIVRAFLACGARAAVGSLWPLDDEFTSYFMATLYPELVQGKTLRQAMTHARAAGRLHAPHPYFWGALATFAGHQPL